MKVSLTYSECSCICGIQGNLISVAVDNYISDLYKISCSYVHICGPPQANLNLLHAFILQENVPDLCRGILEHNLFFSHHPANQYARALNFQDLTDTNLPKIMYMYF